MPKTNQSPEFVQAIRTLEAFKRRREEEEEKLRLNEEGLRWYELSVRKKELQQMWEEERVASLKNHPIVYLMFTNDKGERVLATHFLGNTQFNYNVEEVD